MYFLKPAHFKKAFPFHLVVNSTFELCQIGESLKKMDPSLKEGSHFTNHFTLERPKVELLWENRERLQRTACRVLSLACKLTLKYEVLFDEEDNLIVFIGSPMISDKVSLKESNLRLHDFAKHDSTPDLYLASKPKDKLLKERDQLTKELRASEEKLREFASNLEEKVKERTWELEHAKLLAEEASEAKSNFLARMTHELRTPLNGVIGMSSLIAETKLSTEQKEYVDTILQSGQTLLMLINDILDFSKMDAGELKLEYIPLNLPDIARDALHVIQLQALKKFINLRCVISSGIPHIYLGDPVRIKQILLNLLGNAIKFTPFGFIEVGISAQKTSNNKYKVFLSVEDTGIGIPEDMLDSLFDKFSQVDTSITRKFGGTGLGLAITQELTRAMQGEMAVTSKRGIGSKFTAQVLLDVPPGIPLNRPINNPLEGKNVVLLEQNAEERTHTQKLLEEAGFTVVAFQKEEEIERHLQTHKTDLMVADHLSVDELDRFAGNPIVNKQIRLAGIYLKPHGTFTSELPRNWWQLSKPLFLSDLVKLVGAIDKDLQAKLQSSL